MVEGSCLLSSCGGNSTSGSNPDLSAKICRANFGETSASRPAIYDCGRMTSPLARPRLKGNMYYVYIILNESKTRTYTGVTDNVERRLDEHNIGKVKSSSPYRPYKVIHTESFRTLSEARRKERFYKSTTGRRKLKEMVY